MEKQGAHLIPRPSAQVVHDAVHEIDAKIEMYGFDSQ
jgi:hypothetical protein